MKAKRDDPVTLLQDQTRLGAALANLVRELSRDLTEQEVRRIVALPAFLDALEVLEEIGVDWNKLDPPSG